MQNERKSRSDIERDLKEFREFADFSRRISNKLNELYQEALRDSMGPKETGPSFDSLYKIHGPGEYLNRHSKKKYNIVKDGRIYYFKGDESWGSFTGSSKEWEKA